MKIVIAGYECPECGCIMLCPDMDNDNCADCEYPYNGRWIPFEGLQ